MHDSRRPKVIGGIGEKKSNSGSQFYQQDRIYDSSTVATSLSAKLPGGANMYDIEIPLGVLRNVRSEYGKQIRKQYESGRLKVSRHKFLEKEIRNDGMVNTLDSVQKDNLLAVEVREATSKGYAVARSGRDAVNLTMPGSHTRRGRVGVDMANTLDTQCNQGIFVEISENLTVYAVWYPKKQCYIAIRKLTPKECFRLQGWEDEYFDRAQFVNSDSQLYKQAGNGVTVNVVQAITERME